MKTRQTPTRQQNFCSLLIRTKLTDAKSSEQGLTLMECLVGILVTSVILSLIAPMVLLAAATRIQNRRAEQAMEIAQGEIDRARVLVTRGVAKADEAKYLPPKTSEKDFSKVSAPTETVPESSNPDAVTKAREVDIDRDGKSDFFVQTFRDPGVQFNKGATNEQLAIFRMEVRVYSVAAEDALKANVLNKEEALLGLTSSFGSQQTNPLAVLHTEVSRSDVDVSLERFRCYIKPSECP